MTSSSDALAALQAGPLAAKVAPNAPLGPLTTYRVGGAAAALVTLDTPADAAVLAEVIAAHPVDVLAIGRGSNLLVSDGGFDGLAVVLGNGFAEIQIDGHVVTAGAAAKLPVVARTTVQAGLAGFVWAVGVPGSIGGAVRMNAGGHGAEMSDALVDAEVLDLQTGEVSSRSNADLEFCYRSSSVGPNDLVLSARLELLDGDPVAGKAEMLEVVQWRRDNQPGGQNAGSVFTNPEGDSVGRLIDAAGLKGLRVGTAEVSDKHANFIQADAGGRADDVRALMSEIQLRVEQAHGITLHFETHLVGFDHGD
jgi:UDP-N-acetylmuramate dehydrogenase